MNYEVSHVYLDGKIGKEQEKGIEIFNHLKKAGDTTSLMIDDYSLKHGGKNMIDKKYIIVFYSQHLMLSDVKMESEFISIASMFPYFIETKKERFRKDSKYVTFLIIDDMKIKLKDEYDDGKVKYSCPALSASFHLERAGVISQRKIGKQTQDICSILPEEYRFIEEQVVKILSIFDCKNKYIFY